MRIVAGRAKGRQLKGPKHQMRPTSVRVRTALFDILGTWVEGRVVVDLCAGIGSLGLEALSRGAACAVFVDDDARAVRVIQDNIDHCGFHDVSAVWKTDAVTAVKYIADAHYPIDLILADPPYGDAVIHDIIHSIETFPVLASEGVIAMEHSHKEPPKLTDDYLVCIRERRMGDTSVSLYQSPVSEEPDVLQNAYGDDLPIHLPSPRKRR